MKERIAVMLFAVVCLLGLAVWLERQPAADAPSPGAAGPAPGEGAPLLSFRPASVRTIRLRNGAFSIQVQREGDGWSHAANPGQLDEFLTRLRALPEVRPIAGPDARPDQYGLAHPARSVELLRDDGPPIELLLGDRNPAQTGVYVRLGRDGRISLAGALLLWEFEKALGAVTGAPVP